MHINIRIQPRWTFTEVRRAALALARAVERRCSLASSKWWKEERHGVFLDYNQNAKDRTTCSAYSVRPLPDARVSTPLGWNEVMTCDPADFTVLTVPARFAKLGDPHAAMDQHPGTLDALLEMAARDETEGLGDAPWPPHFTKQSGEGRRVAPSRAKKSGRTFTQEIFRPTRRRLRRPPLPQTITEKIRRLDGRFTRTPTPTKPKRGRVPKMPLITIAQSPDRAAAEAGLERWKALHPEAATHLAPDDILVDRMRGSSQIWYRIRINLRNVPEDLRPPQSTPDPDDDPTRAWREAKEPR